MSSGHFLRRLSPLDIPLCLFHAYQCENIAFYRTLICPRDDIIPLFRSSSLRGSPERRSDRTDFPFMEAQRRQKEDVLTAPRLTAFVICCSLSAETNCCRTSARGLAAALLPTLTPADAEQMCRNISQASVHPSLMVDFI